MISIWQMLRMVERMWSWMITICKNGSRCLPDIPVKILEDVYFNPNETGFLFVKDHQALQEKWMLF